MRTQDTSVVAVSVTANFIVSAQHASDFSVSVTAKFICEGVASLRCSGRFDI